MARYSETIKGMKIGNGDIVKILGVIGKVETVMISSAFDVEEGETVTQIPGHALVEVDLTHGTGATNFFNFSEIEAIRFENKWVDRQGNEISA